MGSLPVITSKSSGEPPGHTLPERGSPSSKGGGDFSYQTFPHPDQLDLFTPVPRRHWLARLDDRYGIDRLVLQRELYV